MSLRVLHVITGLERGGAESMLFRVVTGLAGHGSDHRVVALGREGPWAPRLREAGIPTLCLGLPGCAGALAAARRWVGRAEDAWRPHVVQGWMYHGNLAAALLPRVLGGAVPLLWNIRIGLDHLHTYRPSTRFAIRMGALMSKLPAGILFNARSSLAQHRRLGYAAERCRYLPNGFDLGRFRPDPEARVALRRSLGLSEDILLAGLFARFHPEKNHRAFLEALAQEPPEVHAVLAGQGAGPDEPALVDLVKRFGLQERVHLLGAREDLPALTAALDVAVSASWNEGFSNTLGEALACGVPCLATAVGDSAALVGACGLVVPPGDVGGLARGLAHLRVLGAEGRRALGAEGRRRMEATYGLPRVVEAYGALYEAVAAGRPLPEDAWP